VSYTHQQGKEVVSLEKSTETGSRLNATVRWLSTTVIIAILATSILFTMGYSSDFIYLIGYTNQLIPLFEGIIIGTFVFSFAGSFAGSKNPYILAAGVIVSAVFLMLVFLILQITDYVVPNHLLTISAIMICSMFLPALQFGRSALLGSQGLRGKVVLPLAVSILSIIIVAYSAVIYEKSGQSNLAEIVSVLDYAAIAILAAAASYFLLKNRHTQGKSMVEK
jgi:TM2 domain-containing membrane protein YozV